MYGACYDGHIHAIESQYVVVALKKKNHFKSYMFKKSIATEADIPTGKFIRLPGINCPNTFFFPYQLPNNKSTVFEHLKPFTGDSDSRTGSEFLNSFENHVDREKTPKWASASKLMDLAKESITIDSEVQSMMPYEDLRQEFLLRFWSVEHQFDVYSKFLKSSYPMLQNQKVSEYVQYWIDRMGRNTIILTHEFIDSLINRIPVRYAMRLMRRAEGVGKMCEVNDLIKACESDLCLIERKGWW